MFGDNTFVVINSSSRSQWVKAAFYQSSVCEPDRQHDDVIKWKHFPRYWPFVRGIHRSCTKASDTDVFFDLRLNKRFSKQWWAWRFEMPSSLLSRHCNARGPKQVWQFVWNQQNFTKPLLSFTSFIFNGSFRNLPQSTATLLPYPTNNFGRIFLFKLAL